MQLVLKIDVDTYRGTREGVPKLVEMLRAVGAGATFLFSLGPDHTGRAVRRALRPGFMKKVSRTSVLEHYGLRTLLYGTLLPGPDIGVRCADELRAVRAAGFEVGIHTWDHVRWQDGVVQHDEAWAECELRRAWDRFVEVFGEPPRVHGAAGWQMSRAAYRLEQRLGFAYASDGRGSHPFLPVCEGEIVRCPQIPTTLPTLDELIGVDGITVANVHEHLLRLTAEPRLHVYTLHAELEGQKLAPVFQRLLAGWQAQGYQLVALADVAAGLQIDTLPRHVAELGSIPGRSGVLAVQGRPFLADL